MIVLPDGSTSENRVAPGRSRVIRGRDLVDGDHRPAARLLGRVEARGRLPEVQRDRALLHDQVGVRPPLAVGRAEADALVELAGLVDVGAGQDRCDGLVRHGVLSSGMRSGDAGRRPDPAAYDSTRPEQPGAPEPAGTHPAVAAGTPFATMGR
jgi:hypothetical protein